MYHNNLDSARLLLDFKADINVNDAYDFSPLHLAARNGYLKMVRMLLNMGADVNASNKFAVTPLHLAAVNGHLEVARLLLDQNCLLDVEDAEHQPLLYWVISNNKIEAAELLLSYQNRDINDLLDGECNNLLHLKSIKGDLETIGWLLSKGVNVNAVNVRNETPLHFAVMGRHTRTVEALLNAGASANAGDVSSKKPLHVAAENGCAAVVNLLLNARADANAADELASTPLHLAAEKGFAAVVKLLLSAGASVNVADESDSTPLHLAASNGRTAVVKLLLRAGSSVNAADRPSNTPLHLAASNSCTSVVRLLLSAGADVNAANANHLTSLHLANHKCREVLQQHVAKMMALNLFVSEGNSLAVRSDDEMISFKLKCEEEIELMKSDEIISGVSFVDILTKNPRKLTMYARNEEIAEVFKSNVYASRFPIYAGKIKDIFVPAILRGELLESGHKFFELFLSGHPRLSYLCSEEILKHLSNRDLQFLKDLAKSVKN